jgi:hypothetical protein
MVVMLSASSSVFMMNQKSILTMLTTQIALVKSEMRLGFSETKSYSVEVESIAKHKFPEAQGPCFEGFEGALDGQGELQTSVSA